MKIEPAMMARAVQPAEFDRGHHRAEKVRALLVIGDERGCPSPDKQSWRAAFGVRERLGAADGQFVDARDPLASQSRRLPKVLLSTIQNWPTVNAALVSTMNLTSPSRRDTYSSCATSMGKSWRHFGWSASGRPSGGTVAWSRPRGPPASR